LTIEVKYFCIWFWFVFWYFSPFRR